MNPKELLELIKKDIPVVKGFVQSLEGNPQLESLVGLLFPKLAPVFGQIKQLAPYLDHIDQVIPYIDFLEQVLVAAKLG